MARATAEDWSRPRSELVAFLARGGYFARPKAAGDDRVLTHTLMDGERGGRVAVPDDALSEFYRAYGADLERGVPLFVVERRSAVFRLHFDVDFKVVASDEDVAAFLDVACEAVRGCFGGRLEEARCLCCAAQRGAPRVVAPAAPRQTPGLHLHFPWAAVDEGAALRARAAVVDACENSLRWPGVVWDTALDVSTLRAGGGLRLNGSDKCKVCEECGGRPERRLFCAGCGRRGRKAQNKVYWPWSAWPPGDGRAQAALADAVANAAHGVRLCSVRLPARSVASPHFAAPRKRALEPPPPPSSSSSSSSARASSSRAAATLSDAAAAALLRGLRAAHPAWAELAVRDVERWGGDAPRFAVRVTGPGCRFCVNKDGEHGSQSVYFVVTEEGLRQRCFSRKREERRFGFCADFSSIPAPLPSELLSELFDA